MRPETLLLIDEDVSRGRALHGRYRNQAWEVIWAQAPEDVRQFVHDRGIEPLVVLAGSNAEPADWHARPAQWIALGNEVGDRVRTAGMRPFATLDWPVELERLDSVVFVGRPAFGQEHSTVGLFKLTPNGEANRVQVKLGRSSVNTIEIVEGLVPGDEVILSDMSQWDAFDRVRLGS